jgi:hypothetical protein
LKSIPAEAVVMTERFDKLIVPDRLRIIPATDGGAFSAAAVAASYAPVYWYGLDPSEAELARLKGEASEHDLMLTEPISPIAGETLYRLESVYE